LLQLQTNTEIDCSSSCLTIPTPVFLLPILASPVIYVGCSALFMLHIGRIVVN